MIFTQAGDTKKCTDNRMQFGEYLFAVMDIKTNNFRLKGEKIGWWSIPKRYSTGFRLEVIL